MKHTLSITLILLGIFLLAQFVGLGIVYKYIDFTQTQELGKTTFKDLPIGERPPVEENNSYIPVIFAVLIGTGLLLLLIKFKLGWLQKFWFTISVVIALIMAFGAFMPKTVAIGLALFLGIWKIFKPNFWVQNFTELFIYGGLAAIFVPLFNIRSAVILLILIAIYDAYAVWKSKHMVALAKSQMKEKIFAGLLVPYHLGKKTSLIARKHAVPQKAHMAILGGGDIAFPLIFSGVIIKEMGLWQSLIIPFFALGGLAFLLWWADKGKFYPAMPFISAGCFVGLGVVWLIGLVV